MHSLSESAVSWAATSRTGMAEAQTDHGHNWAIGGFALLESSEPLLWFAECYDVQEVLALGLQMQLQAQRDIICYEILAQHALLCLVASRLPTGPLLLSLPTLSDNTGSESSVNKLFRRSTSLPYRWAFRHRLRGASAPPTHISWAADTFHSVV